MTLWDKSFFSIFAPSRLIWFSNCPFLKGRWLQKLSICTDCLIDCLYNVNRSLFITGHPHCQQSDSNFRCLLSAYSIWVERFILLCHAWYSYPDPHGISIHYWHLKKFLSSLWTKAFLGEGNSSSQFRSQGYRMVKIVTLLISKNNSFQAKHRFLEWGGFVYSNKCPCPFPNEDKRKKSEKPFFVRNCNGKLSRLF